MNFIKNNFMWLVVSMICVDILSQLFLKNVYLDFATLVLTGFWVLYSHFSLNKINAVKNHVTDFVRGFQNIQSDSRSLYSMSDELKKVVYAENEAVTQSSTALEEISAMLSKTAFNSEELEKNSDEAKTKVQEGKSSIDDLQNRINEINNSMIRLDEIAVMHLQNLEKISESMREINQKSKVINDIVFQTKLLSFNASVEAARAGEHGKGFAVVAEEIANLAQSSGQASLEIAQILEINLKKTSDVVEKMKVDLSQVISESKHSVEASLLSSQNSQDIFEHIVKSVEDVAVRTSEISLAAKEQDIGVREITEAVNKLHTTSEHLTKVADGTLKSALNLSTVSDKQTDFLKVLVHGVEADPKILVVPFNFDSAISAHIDWKMKLTKYMANPDRSLKSEIVCKDNQCALGKWIYGDGQEHRHYHEYEQLRTAHAEFHQTAGDVINLIHAGKVHEANNIMSPVGRYASVSDKCVNLIKLMKQNIEGETQLKTAS